MSDYPGCTSSENILCKHVRAQKTYYVNLDFLPEGVTATSATADTNDTDLTIVEASVLDADMTIDESQGCAGDQLLAGRAILVQLSGGESDDDEVIVTVCWVQSDGDTDCRDCRLILSGET